jgi:hypothetical protein
MPKDILGDDYDEIKGVLEAYSRSKQPDWDDFAKKLTPVIRAAMTKHFEECRENGFFYPHIGSDGKIAFHQAAEMHKTNKEVYRVEMKDYDGNIFYKIVGKEWLRPNMKIVKQIK